MDHMMMGALGSYPVTREASGTSWQPDSSMHSGAHLIEGDWMLMGHALLNGVYDWQQGPRGDTDTFVSGMAMGMVNRHFESGDTLQFRAMMSPEPLMGKSGYPLLLATGENFPDALSGGAFLAHLGAPLVLADTYAVPTNTTSYLQSVRGSVTGADLFGGSEVLSAGVQTAVGAAIS